MSILFIDSDGELWYDKIEEIKAHLILMPYTINGEEHFDDNGLTSDYKDFFDKLRNNGSATTAALNVADYITYFEPYFEAGEDILYISFSHKMSATFTFLDQAVAELKAKYPKATFTRFDTLSISMGAGYQFYYGGKMFNKTNGDIAKTIDYLTELSKHTACCFVVDDLYHLKKGGRISSATAAVGSLLGIKPVLKIVDDGSIQNVDKVKGSKKVISYLFDQINNNIDDLSYDIWIMHGDSIEPAQHLKDLINEKYPDTKVHLQLVGPVIGTHCGPGTLAVIYHGKTR
ncbi:MAG: DegV family protein [Clostridia bacterium]|nr:DegV family protein [Clostridia bacterium]